MKLTHIDEPELEFGTGKHIDIRFGLRNYGPLDFKDPSSPKQINVGIIGTPETIDGVTGWIDKCCQGIAAKASKQPHLFSDFPGFSTECNLQSSVHCSANLQSSIPATVFRKLKEGRQAKAAVDKSVESFLEHIEGLASKNTNVIICAPPMELIQAMSVIEDVEQPNVVSNNPVTQETVPDFHDLLKAKSMAFGKPIQRFLSRAHTMSQKDGLRGVARTCSRVIKMKPRALGTSMLRFTIRLAAFRGDSRARQVNMRRVLWEYRFFRVSTKRAC